MPTSPIPSPAPVVPIVTSAALTYWVDAVNGSDITGDGSSAKPWQTIGHAQVKAPQRVAHLVTLKVKAGTYNESVSEARALVQLQGLGTSFVIEGVDFTTPTLGSGSLTAGTLGTATNLPRTTSTTSAGALCSYPVAGAAWTPNELIGMFVNISGFLYPIAGNTATTLEIPFEGLATRTFSIVQHAVILGNAPGSLFAASAAGGLSNTGGGFRFKNLAIKGNAAYGLAIDQGLVHLEGCYVGGATNTACRLTGPLASIYLDRSFVSAPSGGYGVLAPTGATSIVLSGAVVDGAGVGNRLIYVANSMLNNLICIGHAIIQRGSFGAVFHAGPGFIVEDVGNHMIVRNCTLHGINVCAGVRWASYSEIFNCPVGIRFRVDSEGYPNGHNSALGFFFIHDCSSAAVSMGGKFNSLGLTGGEIKGCGVGIDMYAEVAKSGFNSLTMNTGAVTMSGNGSDVRYPGAGSSGVSLATLTTAGTTLDANSSTRIVVA